ncbi:hypothetical protein N7466_005515 [Penicillium verhagenii]|uniref:uncharacterized protein n=1 Tax=Penicillium verhagenii TaxID=1562060 RepID=UPI002544D936|nr:uncharacterized protein N7466_005515 [Penicillium verhagenii]KAJ5930022.1 hypothetical protein N7466_005515 [Penicillium verhagenii]
MKTIILEYDVLDVLGQQPGMHRLYTQICCVYPMSDPSVHDTIVNTLRYGLDRLAKTFPWLAGEVINEGSSAGNTGIYRIIPSETIPLIVKDLCLDNSAPTMDTLRKSKFPMSMLEESIIAPCLTINLPGNTVGLAAESAPVFAVQANFITGGLMLTIVGQHNVMDMTGQDNIIRWMSKACHGIPFTAEEVSIGNMDRTKTITLLDEDYTPGPELDEQTIKPPSNNMPDVSGLHPVKLKWAYVNFSPGALQTLKSSATNSRTVPSGFVSTDDTVCAFMWKCVSRARVQRLDSTTKSTFARAVDVRERLGVPTTYPGMLQSMAYNSSTLQDLVEQPLGAIASEFRRQLDPKVRDLAYNTRALATYLTRSPDKTKVSFLASVELLTGIALSSWARIKCYDFDFNLGLGTPESVRRPAFMPFESLLYIMPKSPQGDMAVAVCVREEDWGRLRADEEFGKYATYIG